MANSCADLPLFQGFQSLSFSKTFHWTSHFFKWFTKILFCKEGNLGFTGLNEVNKFLYSWTLQTISVVNNDYKYNVYFINIKIILSISQFFCVILGSLAKTEDTLLRRCTALWFISNLKDQ